MKKQYEKDLLSISISICILIMEVFFLVYLLNSKIVLYKKFSGVVSKEDTLSLVLNDEELKLFYKNRILYAENAKKKFVITKVLDEVLERGGSSYNQVFIESDISDMYKVGDVVEISIVTKSVRSINLFKVIWG